MVEFYESRFNAYTYLAVNGGESKTNAVRD